MQSIALSVLKTITRTPVLYNTNSKQMFSLGVRSVLNKRFFFAFAGSARPGGRLSSTKPKTEKAGTFSEDQPTSKERVEFVGGAMATQQADTSKATGSPKNAARPGTSIMLPDLNGRRNTGVLVPDIDAFVW
jgi:hypothetical protein